MGCFNDFACLLRLVVVSGFSVEANSSKRYEQCCVDMTFSCDMFDEVNRILIKRHKVFGFDSHSKQFLCQKLCYVNATHLYMDM